MHLCVSSPHTRGTAFQADARGSALGNKTFDPCFGLVQQQQQQLRRDVPAPGNAYIILDSVRPSGLWCFPVREGRVFVGTAAAAAVAASCFAAAQQQQQQPPAAAPAAGSSRQQAAAGISRQQQTQANAAVSATAAVKQLAASQQPASRNV